MRTLAIALVTVGAVGCAPSPELRVRGPIAAGPEAIEVPALRAPPSDEHERLRPTDVERAEGLLWRFHAGAPVTARPLVAPNGDTYVGTTDGHVHKLGASGGFEWSYNVRGAVSGAMAFDPRGLVYVGTSASRVWALRPGGTMLWMHQSNAPVLGDLAFDERRLIYFAGADDHVHAVSPWGNGKWRAPVFAPVTAGPVASGDKLVVATAAGTLVFVRGVLRHRTVPLGSVVVEPLVTGPGGDVYAVAGERLVAVGPDGQERWSRAGVVTAPVVDGDALVVGEHERLVRLDSAGSELAVHALDATASAACAVVADRTFVPTRGGELVVVRNDGGVERRLRIGRAPVHAPVVDAARRRVVVASGDGTVAAVAIGPAEGAE